MRPACFQPTVSLPVERFSRASVTPGKSLTPASILAMQLAHRAPLTATSNCVHAVVAAVNIARQVVGNIGGAQRQGHGTHSLRVASNGAFPAMLLTITSQDPALTLGQLLLIRPGIVSLSSSTRSRYLVGGMAKLPDQ